MRELYSLVVDGHMAYFFGDLSNNDIQRIEESISKFGSKTTEIGHEAKQKEFFNTVISEMQLKITPLQIKHVFRT